MKTPHLILLALTLVLAPWPSAVAAEPKRVIVCTVTTGFRHSSIPFAEKTLQKLGEESKAFTVVALVQQPKTPLSKTPPAPKKPAALAGDADDAAKAKHAEESNKFTVEMERWVALDQKAQAAKAQWDAEMKTNMAKLSPEYLVAQKIDAVIFANTTGDLPLPDRDGFIRWVEAGHGFCGMHSAGDTFHGFPAYLDMVQAEFKTHGNQVPADLIAGDQTHPANGGIGETWKLTQEEMYEFKPGSHDRAKVRALWFLRHHPQDAAKLGYAPVSWCRIAGQGRVFYTSLGHREDLWDETDAVKDRKNSAELSKQFQAHILGGIQWALGLAPGRAEPNPDAQ